MKVVQTVRDAFLSRRWRGFLLRIVLPAALAGVLFVLAIFLILIPSMERQMMDGKKETIRELTRSAISVLDEYYGEEQAGRMTREQAQKEAAERVELLSWGDEGKDYFWITDMQPVMIAHPYRPDLIGEDLSDFEDLRGKRMFVAFVEAVRDDGYGYVDYYWQWKDDPNDIVPKLSYVELFEPWQWVVGTGIYIEDVRAEIARVRQNLTFILIGITAVVAILLFYSARQSLKIERRRAQAEEGLRESNEKYRALVEAATEGILMFLEGRYAYSNKVMADLLGYAPGELDDVRVEELVDGVTIGEPELASTLSSVARGELPSAQFEGRLRTRDGGHVEALLTATPIDLAGRAGFILITRTLESQKAIEAALDETRRQFRTMSNALSLGVFRSTWGRRAVLVDANPAMRSILGVGPIADVTGVDWLDRIADADERAELVSRLNREKVVEGFRATLRQEEGRRVEVSLFAVLVDDESGEPAFCDGIAEDITERKKSEAEREALIAELQTSLFFLQEPITQAIQPAVACEMNQPISRAATLMTRNKAAAVIITGPGGELMGIVTDHDMRSRVVAQSLDATRPVHTIMTSPLVTISDKGLVYEALLAMQERDISHLAVVNDGGALVGVVRQRDLIQYQRSSSVILTDTIRHADTVDDIMDAHARLPGLVKALIDSGAKVRHVNRMISSVSDGVVERLLVMAVEQLGPAPVRYAFLTLGSEGREEQTLLTDQDNAIVYEDPAADDEERVSEYFLALGTLVCHWLDQVGYRYCEGGVMAKNAQWNGSLSTWKARFTNWIHNANPQELLELNMAFDFRCVSGDAALARELRTHAFDEMQAYPPFFLHFAQNALLYKPPLGFRGNILVESSGEGAKALNLKEALMPVVNFARLYALKYRIEATHTLDRLAALHEKGMLSDETFDEVGPDYENLMRMRLHRQAVAIQEKRRPTNLISPQEWTALEEAMLKRLFNVTANLRRKISFDFLGGSAGG